jgi:hypothetical protein
MKIMASVKQVGHFTVRIEGGSPIDFNNVERHEFSENNGGYLAGTNNGEAIFIGYAQSAKPNTESTYLYTDDFENKPHINWTLDYGSKRYSAVTGRVTVKFSHNLEASGSFDFTDGSGKKIEGKFEIKWN